MACTALAAGFSTFLEGVTKVRLKLAGQKKIFYMKTMNIDIVAEFICLQSFDGKDNNKPQIYLKDCQVKVSYQTFKTANMPHIVHCFPCMTRYMYLYFPLWVFSEKSS